MTGPQPTTDTDTTVPGDVSSGPDGEYARRVTARWRATGPVGRRDAAVIHASAGALAYAEQLLRPATRDDHEEGDRVASALSFDELVDLERALAAHYPRGTGFPAVLESVETHRQGLQHDDPQAWTRHLSVCLGCARRPIDVPDTECAVCRGAAELERYERARDWMVDQGASTWEAEAFGHWVIAEIVPRGPVPEQLSALIREWHHDPVPRAYRARHGARPVGSPRWTPGDPLPAPVDLTGP